MASSVWALIAEIKQDVGRIANKIARGVANVAFEDLKTAHAEIMNSYYAGYDPVKTYWYHYEREENNKVRVYEGYAHGYRRTNNLRENSIIPQGVTASGTHGFKAVVNIGSDRMNDYVNSTGHTFPSSVVFDLVWNQGIRGLPPGNRGHIGPVDINASPVGVPISGRPYNAMKQFVDTWGAIRGGEVADQIAHSI